MTVIKIIAAGSKPSVDNRTSDTCRTFCSLPYCYQTYTNLGIIRIRIVPIYTYSIRSIVALSHKYFYNGNTAMCSMCTVELNVTVNYIQMFSIAQKCSIEASVKDIQVFI
jgi:hypothetical protein